MDVRLWAGLATHLLAELCKGEPTSLAGSRRNGYGSTINIDTRGLGCSVSVGAPGVIGERKLSLAFMVSDDYFPRPLEILVAQRKPADSPRLAIDPSPPVPTAI
jgi:hypothetical protein